MAVAVVTVDELEARARLESGLRNNAYYDSASIVRYLNSGGAELYDLFTAANQHYNVTTYDFTPAAGAAGSVQSLPDDFQQGHSLEVYPDSPGQTRTIKFLSNWLNRNAYAGAAFPILPGGGPYPAYTFLDNKLRFYPPQGVPAAPFRLYYTPLWTTLAPNTFLPDTLPGAGDGWTAGSNRFDFDNAGAPGVFLVGQTLTVIGTGQGANLDGVYTITGVLSGGAHVTVTPSPPNPTVSRVFDTGTVCIIGPPATRQTLPPLLTSWSEYLVIYAAIAINIDRQRGTADLERKLQALKARVSTIVSVRQEEPQQPPLTRDMGGMWGGGWGGGGWSGW